MKTCPHCQFLVHDGMTNCGVCKRPLSFPDQPAGPWGAPPELDQLPAAPGAAAAAAVSTGAGPFPPGAAVGRPRRSTGSVVAIVVGSVLAVVIGLGVLAGAAVTFLGTSSSTTTGRAAGPTEWSTFEESGGRFTVELPGRPESDTQAEDIGLSAPITVDMYLAAHGNRVSAVGLFTLPPEARGVPISLESAMAGGLATMAPDARVVASTTRPIEDGEALDAEAAFTRDGREAVGFLRMMTVHGRPFMIVTLGPDAEREEAERDHRRVVDSFRADPSVGD